MIYAPIYDRIPLIMREKLLEHFGEQHRIGRIQRDFFDNAVNTSKKIGHHDNLYLVDGAILSKVSAVKKGIFSAVIYVKLFELPFRS